MATVAKVDLPFPIRLRHVLNEAANLRLMPQHSQRFPDGLDGMLRGQIGVRPLFAIL
jgi:hypothetical protein